jgi:predicted ester cyclase
MAWEGEEEIGRKTFVRNYRIIYLALAAFLKGVWTAFPDFSVELLNAGEIEPGLIADHWRVRGTNTGPGSDGSEPTGRTVSFQGASIIRVEGDKVLSDLTYFDRKGLDEQLAPK